MSTALIHKRAAALPVLHALLDLHETGTAYFYRTLRLQSPYLYQPADTDYFCTGNRERIAELLLSLGFVQPPMDENGCTADGEYIARSYRLDDLNIIVLGADEFKAFRVATYCVDLAFRMNEKAAIWLRTKPARRAVFEVIATLLKHSAIQLPSLVKVHK